MLVGGAPSDEDPEASGTTWVLRGPLDGEVGLTDSSAALRGQFEDEAAILAAAAGDLNADGYGDILVGAEDVTYVVHSPVTGVHP